MGRERDEKKKREREMRRNQERVMGTERIWINAKIGKTQLR